MTNWDNRFIALAQHVSCWSKDTTKVGAIIVDDNNKILSTGYNGMPSWFKDDHLIDIESIKPHMITHAEVNALNCLSPEHYNKNLTLYVTRPVCNVCASFITYSLVNINKIIFIESGSISFDNKYFIKDSISLLKSKNIEIKIISKMDNIT